MTERCCRFLSHRSPSGFRFSHTAHAHTRSATGAASFPTKTNRVGMIRQEHRCPYCHEGLPYRWPRCSKTVATHSKQTFAVTDVSRDSRAYRLNAPMRGTHLMARVRR